MIVSLAAVIIGPIVTFKVAKTQILSPIRQKWIDETRELMSGFLSECEGAIILSEGIGLLISEKTNEMRFLKLLYIERKLALMLNPKEKNHTELIDLIREITNEVQHGVSNFVKFGERVGHATTLCQIVLKIEWDRIKNNSV